MLELRGYGRHRRPGPPGAADLTVLLDLDPDEAVGVKEHKDRLEQAGVEFHRRVRQGFLDLANADPERYLVLPGRQGREWAAGRVREQAAGPGCATDRLSCPEQAGPVGWIVAPDCGRRRLQVPIPVRAGGTIEGNPEFGSPAQQVGASRAGLVGRGGRRSGQ